MIADVDHLFNLPVKMEEEGKIYFCWTLLWFSSQNAEEGKGDVFLLSFVCLTCFGLEYGI